MKFYKSGSDTLPAQIEASAKSERNRNDDVSDVRSPPGCAGTTSLSIDTGCVASWREWALKRSTGVRTRAVRTRGARSIRIC